jgi:hypothetical protein
MDNELNQALEAWKHAGASLGIRVEAPYHTVTADGEKISCLAHFPDFGSPNGMVIGTLISPGYEIDKGVKRVAKELGKYCSFINIKIYAKYDEMMFKDTLIDWGYWGTRENQPQWLMPINHPQANR